MVVLCIIIVVAGGYVVYEQLMSSVNPYISVSELVEKPKDYYGQQVQVMGVVEDGSVKRMGANLTFILTDNASSVKVIYYGDFPSGFQEGNPIVVIGTFQPGLLVQAEKILVKCPSKYEETTNPSE